MRQKPIGVFGNKRAGGIAFLDHPVAVVAVLSGNSGPAERQHPGIFVIRKTVLTATSEEDQLSKNNYVIKQTSVLMYHKSPIGVLGIPSLR